MVSHPKIRACLLPTLSRIVKGDTPVESDSLGCGHTGKIDGGVFARSQDCTVELAGNFADLYWHRQIMSADHFLQNILI